MKYARTLLVLAAAVLVPAGWAWQQDKRERDYGSALFHGIAPLNGRLHGHDRALPAVAVRCVNCHAKPERAWGSIAGGGNTPAEALRPYATRLTGTALTVPRSRRGGPPSSYDAEQLCTLLRIGVDPSRVMIPDTMPRYDISARDCASLWTYLVHEPT